MYIQVRDIAGIEKFIEEDLLESAIASGDIVAFRRSAGWITVPTESYRGVLETVQYSYSGQERRRKKLSKSISFQEPDIK